jgi:hypothetical protein
MRGLLFTFSLLMLCVPLSLCVAAPPLSAEDYEAPSLGTYYARQEFAARTDPDPEAPIRAVLPMGMGVEILSESEDHRWYWISIAKGINAWAPQEELVKAQPEQPPLVEPVLTQAELKKFHHILAIDKAYSLNFGFLLGQSNLKALSGNDHPKTYSALVFGPGVGRRLGSQNPIRNFLIEAKILVAHENFAFAAGSGEVSRSVVSVGGALDIRYLWIHNEFSAGGLYMGLNAMFPRDFEDVGLHDPGILSLRSGVSVSVEIPNGYGIMIFDLGGNFRQGATSFGLSSSLVF